VAEHREILLRVLSGDAAGASARQRPYPPAGGENRAPAQQLIFIEGRRTEMPLRPAARQSLKKAISSARLILGGGGCGARRSRANSMQPTAGGIGARKPGRRATAFRRGTPITRRPSLGKPSAAGSPVEQLPRPSKLTCNHTRQRESRVEGRRCGNWQPGYGTSGRATDGMPEQRAL